MPTALTATEKNERYNKILNAIKTLGPITGGELAKHFGVSRFVIVDAVREMRKGEIGIGIMSSHDKGYWFDDNVVGFKNKEGYNDPTFKLACDNLAKTMMANGVDKTDGKVVRLDKVIFEEGRIVKAIDKSYAIDGISTYVIVKVDLPLIKCVPVGHARAHKICKEAVGEDGILVTDSYKALTKYVTTFDTNKVKLLNVAIDDRDVTKISKYTLERIVNAISPDKEEKKMKKEETTVKAPYKLPDRMATTFADIPKFDYVKELELALAKQKAEIYEKILFAMIGGTP